MINYNYDGKILFTIVKGYFCVYGMKNVEGKYYGKVHWGSKSSTDGVK